MQGKLRILMVCMGNICRSPTMEGVLRARLAAYGLQDRIEVDSAGTHDYHIGRAPDPRSVAAAAQRGYDLSALRARQVQAADFSAFDFVLAADRDNLANLQRLRRGQGVEPQLLLSILEADAEVPDPYYGGPQGFEDVLDLVEAACDAWCRRWQQHLRG
ncbi:low molecular weight protein-tyrosine-phosphatase [Vogesella sp. LIG4]|uniref:low molecular weight protein-tyrosine-phosphatase n=1 Tax=Vogesella sp. LIG4 TaxID=1192162 RepID=UPI00081FEC4E|nr:low molecular weight protein-tyrosine-phosphatase [Vogesella sp. LIG4]SCK20936.1 protein-tyrosine phosphatase [Vogesella sp. LIG4]